MTKTGNLSNRVKKIVSRFETDTKHVFDHTLCKDCSTQSGSCSCAKYILVEGKGMNCQQCIGRPAKFGRIEIQIKD